MFKLTKRGGLSTQAITGIIILVIITVLMLLALSGPQKLLSAAP